MEACIFIILVHLLFSGIFRHAEIAAWKRLFGCEPPSKAGWQLFGILSAFKFNQAYKKRRFLSSLHWLLKKRHHTFSAILPIGKPAIWTDEPANIKAVLSDDFKSYELGIGRHKMLLPILGKGIFTSDGGEWSQYRALIRPCFTKTHLRDLRMFEPHVQNLISQIPKDGVPVDMQELFYDLTMDVTTDFLFGHSAGSLLPDASQENKDFSEAFAHALGRALHRGNLGFLMNWIPDRQFRKSCATVHQFVDKLVKQALDHSSTKNQYVYLHEVLKTTSSPEELRNHAINILIAGRDTTATLLSSIIYLLSRHKVEWERICGEVEHLNGKAPTYKQLKGLKYVHYTMNEGMYTVLLQSPTSANFRSSPPLHANSSQHAIGDFKYYSPCWRRTYGGRTCLLSEGRRDCIFSIIDASSKGYLGRRCR